MLMIAGLFLQGLTVIVTILFGLFWFGMITAALDSSNPKIALLLLFLTGLPGLGISIWQNFKAPEKTSPDCVCEEKTGE